MVVIFSYCIVFNTGALDFELVCCAVY